MGYPTKHPKVFQSAFLQRGYDGDSFAQFMEEFTPSYRRMLRDFAYTGAVRRLYPLA